MSTPKNKSAGPIPKEQMEDLVAASLILAREGILDAFGHVSMRHPADSSRYLLSRNLAPELVTAADIVEYDLDSEPVDPNAPRGFLERYIHGEIYKARPDVNSVIHSHPDHAVAVSTLGRPIRAWSQPSALFVERVGWFTETIDLIRRKDQGAGVAKALGPHSVCMMKSHGVALAGGSIEEAVITGIMLENACRIQLLIEAAGNPQKEFPPDDLKLLQDKITRPEQMVVNFEYLRRKVKRGR